MSLMYQLARGAQQLAGWIPRPARHVLGSAIGLGSYLAWGEKRRVTQRNMAQVTGLPVHHPRVHYLARASWRNYGRYAADFLSFPFIDMGAVEHHLYDLSADGSLSISSALYHTQTWKYFEEARKPGHGVIITTAHFGNWDMAGALIARRTPLYAVAETFRDAQLNDLIQGQRQEKGMTILPLEGTARRVLRVLQQNEYVALVVDRPVSPEEGVPITFFGKTTYVPAGPAALALKSGAALLPGYIWYGLHHAWYGRFFPPVFPRSVKSSEREGEIQRLTQAIYDALEVMVRAWPTQWYMFRAFWPSDTEPTKDS